MEEAWQPDQFLAEFESEDFDVENHATEILRKGNINEEVLKSKFTIYKTDGVIFQVARLTEALQSLDSCIEAHVSDHYR